MNPLDFYADMRAAVVADLRRRIRAGDADPSVRHALAANLAESESSRTVWLPGMTDDDLREIIEHEPEAEREELRERVGAWGGSVYRLRLDAAHDDLVSAWRIEPRA